MVDAAELSRKVLAILSDSADGTVIVGSFGTKLVMTSVVPRLTVTVAIDRDTPEVAVTPTMVLDIVDRTADAD